MLISTLAVAGTSLADSSSTSGWTEYNYDAKGTRDNVAENTLSTSNVGGLKIEWQYATPGPVNATPVVADGVVYASDNAGFMYALTTSGTLLWKTQVNGPITATATITGGMLVFGDGAGYLYGLKRSNGSIVWSFRPDPNPVNAIFGAGVIIGNQLAIGVASNEELAAANPNYPCCSSRGSVVLLDPATGQVAWQTFMVSDADKANGASGGRLEHPHVRRELENHPCHDRQ